MTEPPAVDNPALKSQILRVNPAGKRVGIGVEQGELIAHFLRLSTGNIRSAIAQTMLHPGECRLEFELGSNFEYEGIRIRATTEGFLNIAQSRCSDLWNSKAASLADTGGGNANLSRNVKRALGVCRKLLPPHLQKEDGSITRLVLTFKAGELSSYEISSRDSFTTAAEKYRGG